MRPGDVVTNIQNQEVRYWWQLKQIVSSASGKELKVQYIHKESSRSTTVVPRTVMDPLYALLGIDRPRGMIDVSPLLFRPVLIVQEGGI